MAPKDLDKLIQKYLEGRCTKEENDFVNSWYSALGKNTKANEADVFDNKISAAGSRIFQRLQVYAQQVPQVTLPQNKYVSYFWRYTGIAAGLLFLVAAGFYLLTRKHATSPPVAEFAVSGFSEMVNETPLMKRIILPDGSIVEMSGGSKIRFSKDTRSLSRELFLEGEAYFDVARDPARPFYVYAGDVITKVLGTSFIIRATGANEKVVVSVKTGKVTVYSRKASHKKTVLSPNQEAIYDEATDVVATRSVSVTQSPQARRDLVEMHFEETPVKEVLELLARTYEIDIKFEPEIFTGCVLTSSFFEEGLYDRIDLICTAIGATYKIVDAHIIIESNGCNLKH
jgi:ferric-dicitrate binding protein FerR (iron transport regulator)